MRNRLGYAVVVFAALGLMGAAPLPTNHVAGWCCLCMCHSVNESKCARSCIKMQHGKKIIEEPEMKTCTKACERHRVKQIPSSQLQSQQDGPPESSTIPHEPLSE